MRLFVALWPDGATRDGLVAVRDAWRWSPSARPTRDDRLHTTLHFLGEVAAAVGVADVSDGLGTPFAPFAVAFDRLAVWPNGVAAYEPSRVPDGLAALRADLGEALGRLGIAVEGRAFRPHVTLARDARGSTPPSPFASLVWPVDRYALVASRGGRYTVLATHDAGA